MLLMPYLTSEWDTGCAFWPRAPFTRPCCTGMLTLPNLPAQGGQTTGLPGLLCNQGPDDNLGSTIVMYVLREEPVPEYVTVERAGGRRAVLGVGEAAVAISTWNMIAIRPGGSCGFSPGQLEHPCAVGASLCSGGVPVQGLQWRLFSHQVCPLG